MPFLDRNAQNDFQSVSDWLRSTHPNPLVNATPFVHPVACGTVLNMTHPQREEPTRVRLIRIVRLFEVSEVVLHEGNACRVEQVIQTTFPPRFKIKTADGTILVSNHDDLIATRPPSSNDAEIYIVDDDGAEYHTSGDTLSKVLDDESEHSNKRQRVSVCDGPDIDDVLS